MGAGGHITSGRRGDQLSGQGGAHRAAVRGRRCCRYHGAHCRGKARRQAWAAFLCRESSRRRRHNSGANGDLVCARRLYPGAAIQRDRGQRLSVQEAAVRSASRFRAYFQPGIFRFRVCHRRRLGIQDPGRLCCCREGKTRRAQCRDDQYRQHPEPVGRAVQDGGRHRFHHHPLSGNTRDPGLAAARRDCADDRQLLVDEGQPCRQQVPGAGIVGSGALGKHAGRCHGARERRRRLRRGLLERAVRACRQPGSNPTSTSGRR